MSLYERSYYLPFGLTWIFISTVWGKTERSCRVGKRSPQWAINSDDNDLLTKQSSGLHIPPHCFLQMLMAELSKQFSVLKKMVCMCVHAYRKPFRATEQDRMMTPASVITVNTCLSAGHRFAPSFQGAEPLWGVRLCGPTANQRVGLHEQQHVGDSDSGWLSGTS